MKDWNSSVSVIVPAYNCSATIDAAIESILQQSTPVDEVIVVNDGSSDNTRSVCEAMGKKIKLINQHLSLIHI